MFDANDIAVLREMFSAQTHYLLQVMKENNVQLKTELKREIRDEVHSIIAAAEVRIETRITTNIAELLDASVLPQIAELQQDMQLVKHHLQLA